MGSSSCVLLLSFLYILDGFMTVLFLQVFLLRRMGETSDLDR